jgi:hypothetical protein
MSGDLNLVIRTVEDGSKSNVGKASSAYPTIGSKSKLNRQNLVGGHAPSKAQEKANRRKSKIRTRIEHVFGAQQTSPSGRVVRTICIVRAKAKIGLQNLAYNIRRLVTSVNKTRG